MSFWDTFSSGKHSVYKTTQMPQKEKIKIKIGSKQWGNITPSGKKTTYSGHVTDRKTPNINKIFEDDESMCAGLDRSQNMNASEFPKTNTTIISLQNVSGIERRPEDRTEMTSNMNMLYGANQFESTVRWLHVHGTLCLR